MKSMKRVLSAVMAIIISVSAMGGQVYAAGLDDTNPAYESTSVETSVEETIDEGLTEEGSSSDIPESLSEETADDVTEGIENESEVETEEETVEETVEEGTTEDLSSETAKEEAVPDDKTLMGSSERVIERKNLYNTGSPVSRISWIRTLISKFSLDIDENAYPDDYYPDITPSYTYYREAMIAIKYGFIDIAPGEDFNPDGEATRDFVAHTLNMCLGFVVEQEQDDYTYTDTNDTEYDLDAEAVLRYGFLDPIDGKFEPNRSVTSAEVSEICNVIDELHAHEKVTGSNSYEYKEGVVVLPSDTEIETVDDGVLRIVGGADKVKTGDIFGIVYEEIPLAWKAKNVRKEGADIIVTTDKIEMSEAFDSINVSASGEVDLSAVQAASPTAQMFYVVGGSEENNYEDGQLYSSYEEVQDQEISAIVIEDEVLLGNSGYDYGGDVINGLSYKYSARITNETWDYEASLTHAHAVVDFDVVLSVSVDGDLAKMLDVDLNLLKVDIIPGIYYETSLLFNLKGSLRGEFVEHVHAGAYWDGWFKGLRFEKWMYEKSYTLTGEITGSIGFEFAYKADYLVMDASLYARIGTEATLKFVEYHDGQDPRKCMNMSLWMFAVFGYEMKITGKYVGGDSIDLFNMYNSPVKVCAHWEDGVQVEACTNPERYAGENEQRIQPGYAAPSTKQPYFVPLKSRFYYNGKSSRIGSGDSEIVFFTYTKDDKTKTATITGYSGYCDNMIIPKELDGYTVIKIADEAFKGMTGIRSVSLPDSVTEIGRKAFLGCTGLSSVSMSGGLITIKSEAFENCTSLRNIVIPKSLEKCEKNGDKGIFYGTPISVVQFENGTTKIATTLFASCTSLKRIDIPDSVTKIGDQAFEDCTALITVSFGENSALKTIGARAFEECTALTSFEMPDTVTTISARAFNGCKKLSDIHLSRSLLELKYEVFGGCTSLTSILIPKSLDSTERNGEKGPFAGSGLTDISFEEEITEIAKYLFAGCNTLETVVIPDTVTSIEYGAFAYCHKLKNVTYSRNLKDIGEDAFRENFAMTEAVLPDSITNINMSAYRGCSNLSTVHLPAHIKTMGSGAFADCVSLKEIFIPASLECKDSYGLGFFNNSHIEKIEFEEGITKIARGLCKDISTLKTLKIPDSVETIGEYAFRNCKGITIEMGSNIKTIGQCAFMESGIKSLEIPESVRTIGQSAFKDSVDLESINIPAGVTEIPWSTFDGCVSLKTVIVPEDSNIRKIGQEAFENCAKLEAFSFPKGLTLIESKGFSNCDSLTEVMLPDSLTSMYTEAFSDCDKLATVKISSGLTSLNSKVFQGCELLKNVNLGTGLTEIGTYAFEGCEAMESIVFPNSLTTIKGYAFANNPKLTHVTMPESITSIADTAFSYPTSMTVYGIRGSYAETWAENKGATFEENKLKAETLVLSDTEITVAVGATAKLFYTITPSGFIDGLKWKSSDTSIATVAEDGTVKGVKSGKAKITLLVGDDLSSECMVTVVQPVSSVTVKPTSLTLDTGDIYELAASVKPDTAFDKTLTWSSSNENVVTVDENGKVTAIALGTATITAASNDGTGKTGTCGINVANEVIRCTDWTELESKHKYTSGETVVWKYVLEGANKLYITFDARTSVEDGADYIYLYDGSGKEAGKYTGTALAGKKITITGDTVKIMLKPDDAGNDWGFKVVELTDGTPAPPKKCVVTFNPGEGSLESGSENTKTVTYGDAYGPLPSALHNDKVFMGWYTLPEEGDRVTAATTVSRTDDHTLYAHYKGVETLAMPYVCNSAGDGYESGTELNKGTRLYLKSDELNAAIYYSTDGSDITEDDAHLYKGSIELTADTTVRAYAVKQGFNRSPEMSASFTVKSTASDWGDIVENDRAPYADADEVPEDIWVAGYKDMTYMGTAVTFGDDLHVYYHKTLLAEGTDYTVKYSNNVKASTDKSKATITVTGKGNYNKSRKVSFNILPRSISEGAKVYDVEKPYNGSIQKAVTTVMYTWPDGRSDKLKAGTDFTYDYFEVKSEPGEYTVKIIGKGNYSDEATFVEKIYEKGDEIDISKLSFSKIKSQPSTGEEIKPPVKIFDRSCEHYLVDGTDFESEYFNCVTAGTATVVVSGKGRYVGTKTLTYKITGLPISKAGITYGQSAYYCCGEQIRPEFELNYRFAKGEDPQSLTEGVDYEISSFGPNINKGNGKVIIKGKGRFAGTATKTFKIQQQSLTDGHIRVIDETGTYESNKISGEFGEYTYTKGGVKPKVKVVFGDSVELKEGKDYTVKYSNNNAVAGTKQPKLTITGKGNYKGKIERTFEIKASSLDETSVVATDIKWANKAGICKPSITVYDSNGVKLKAGTDYDKKTIEYTYESDAAVVRNGNTIYVVGGADPVDLKKDIIPAGTEIRVTIHGKGNYASDSSQYGVFTYVDELISKATIKPRVAGFVYTGKEIEISEDDLIVKIGRRELPLGSYKITGYNANINKGTAKVTVEGTGKYADKYYGGVKTITFKIYAKSMN